MAIMMIVWIIGSKVGGIRNGISPSESAEAKNNKTLPDRGHECFTRLKIQAYP